MMDTEESAFLQGKVIQGLEDLTGSVTEMREDFRLFKVDSYGKINKNSLDISRLKGWMAGCAVIIGIVGVLLRVFWR